MKSLLVSALLAPSLGLNVLLLVGLTAPESVGPLARLVRAGATDRKSTRLNSSH